jgi:hypothetical protein
MGSTSDLPVLAFADAEDSTNPVCRRARDDGEAAAVANAFVHSVECAEPGKLQAELLREQELLRSL